MVSDPTFTLTMINPPLEWYLYECGIVVTNDPERYNGMEESIMLIEVPSLFITPVNVILEMLPLKYLFVDGVFCTQINETVSFGIT
jgi:hypothetical protein